MAAKCRGESEEDIGRLTLLNWIELECLELGI